jgi:uncharacterized membrane protein
MKQFLSITILLSLLSACNSDSSRLTGQQTPASQDSAAATQNDKKDPADSTIGEPKDSIQFTEKEVYGLYDAMLPCKDCKGHRMMVLFSPRGYHIEENYIDKDLEPLVDEGQWTLTNNRIHLRSTIPGGGAGRNFLVAKGGLVFLDALGKPMPGGDMDKYRLKKKVIGADNKAWMEKKKKGIDFICVGNEPFWALDLDKGSRITFLLAETNVPVDFPYVAPVNEGGTLKYNTEAGANRLELLIVPTFCGDGMSDTWYEYEVKLKYNDVLYKGCGVALRAFY